MMMIPRQALALALATFDAVQGSRALHQLRPHLSPRAFNQLVAYRDASAFKVSASGHLRMSCPTTRSVEASGTLLVRGRWLACALRLDWLSRWVCSELRVVGYPA